MSSKNGFEILNYAKCVLEERQDMYGNSEDSFGVIAGFWDVYLNGVGAMDNDYCITPKDVAMMMSLMKIAREINAHKYDNLVDIIGYVAHASKMQSLTTEREEETLREKVALTKNAKRTRYPVTYEAAKE